LQVSANIIAMYPSTSLFIAVGQLAIAILVLLSYPLQVHPCRNCLDKVFHFESANKLEGDVDEDEHETGEMSPLKHTLLTTAVVFGGFSIAYFVDNLEMGTDSIPPTVRAHLSVELTPRSAVLCRVHRVNHYFVHPPWTVLLEGKFFGATFQGLSI
jgi:hypothetical protein